jgi:hypothetical protein
MKLLPKIFEYVDFESNHWIYNLIHGQQDWAILLTKASTTGEMVVERPLVLRG